MRKILTAALVLVATAAQAEFLTDYAGMWEGQGQTTGGIPFTYYARIDSNGAKWNSVNDGCEGTWDFQKVYDTHADGWENVTIGQDRCVLGLRVVLTPYNGGRIKAEWSTMHGAPVASAVFMPVQ